MCTCVRRGACRRGAHVHLYVEIMHVYGMPYARRSAYLHVYVRVRIRAFCALLREILKTQIYIWI